MRRLKRNQRSFQYCLYTGMTDETGEDGFKTGRKIETYTDPVEEKGCIVFKGSSSYKPYGIDEDFTVQVIPDAPITGISTTSKVVIDGKEYQVKSHPTTINEQRLFCK